MKHLLENWREYLNEAQVKWKEPDFAAERGEYQRHAPRFGLTAEELEGYIKTNGHLISMSEELYDTLQNTQMREVENVEDLDRIGKENNKDFEGIKSGIEQGAQFNAPIVVHKENEDPWLIAGNTRLVAAAAYDLPVQVWYVKL